ncbi:MAG: T9SS type A sorting domain-containing protein [Bacteroidia bacterium]|jgi:hypothetical protein
MKKVILFLAVLLSFRAYESKAQCTPDIAIDQKLMHPDTLAEAMVGYYYSQVLTFRVPADTTIIYNGNQVNAVIDSMRMLAILGIPDGYGYVCNPASCTWKGGTLGCALIQGNIAQSDSALVGEYPIKMYVYTWARLGGVIAYTRADSSAQYVFKVRSYNGTFEISRLEPLKIFPNPSTGNFRIELRDIQSNNNLLQVMDATGRIVYENRFDKPGTFLSIQDVQLGEVAEGVYHVSLIAGDRILQQKVVIH